MVVFILIYITKRVLGAQLISQILSVQLIFRNGLLVRIVSRSFFDAHANPIFVSLRILKFEDIIKLQIGKVMYLYKNGLLPNSFNDIFLLNCD